jgi:hypothetical protein
MKLAVTQILRSAVVVLLGSLAASVAFAQNNANEHNNPSAPTLTSQNVLVVNGSGQPIPTAPQGTTNVAGTVSIGNNPTVNLAAGSGITVSNRLDGQNNPAPLSTLEAVQIYDSSCAAAFNGGSDATCLFQAVPSGKRLVIDEFDSFGLMPTGINPLVIGVNTLSDTHFFPTASIMASGSGSNSFMGHQQTRLYLRAGVTPQCHVILSGVSGAEWDCQISGFLVDVP